MFLQFEVIWGLLLTLLLVGLFGMGLHGFGSLDFLAASRSNGSLAKLCSVTFKGKNFSPIVQSQQEGELIEAFEIFNYPRIYQTIKCQ